MYSFMFQVNYMVIQHLYLLEMVTVILVYNHPCTKLWQNYIPYSLGCILCPLAYLLYNWKFATLSSLHLFHPTHRSTPLWQTPICSLYLSIYSHIVWLSGYTKLHTHKQSMRIPPCIHPHQYLSYAVLLLTAIQNHCGFDFHLHDD